MAALWCLRLTVRVYLEIFFTAPNIRLEDVSLLMLISLLAALQGFGIQPGAISWAILLLLKLTASCGLVKLYLGCLPTSQTSSMIRIDLLLYGGWNSASLSPRR